MTVIRTQKAKYTVEGVNVDNGKVEILARSAGGKLQRITRKRAGRPRFDSALAHWWATHPVSAG